MNLSVFVHCQAQGHGPLPLSGTKDYKLTYAPTPSKERFLVYSDADFAGDHDSKKSTSGYVVKMGTGAVSWASRLQTIQTLSTTEAEYVAACSAAQEALWMCNLFIELGYPVNCIPMYIDNQSALSVAKNPEHQGRMKHLPPIYYGFRDSVEDGEISPFYVPTADMPADMLTKALTRDKVEKGVKLLGLGT